MQNFKKFFQRVPELARQPDKQKTKCAVMDVKNVFGETFISASPRIMSVTSVGCNLTKHHTTSYHTSFIYKAKPGFTKFTKRLH